MSDAWAFATRIWERPAAAAICLELQDRHGQCVTLLLWRLWTLAQSRRVDLAAAARATDLARSWDTPLIEPLRAVRRGLPAGFDSVGAASGGTFRERLLAVEVDAEHALLDALQAITDAPGTASAPPLPALMALAESWRPPAPAELLAKLLEAT